MPDSRSKRLGFETLEKRELLAGDLFYDPGAPGSFDRIVLVAGDGSDIVGDPTPVVGQKVYVAIDWSAVGLDVGDSYFVEFDMDGVNLAPVYFEPFSGSDDPFMYHGGWFAQPGTTHTITITLDPHNTVAETSENNNTFSLQFTTIDPTSLPSKFITPIAGTQNEDWVLGGYVDINPKVDGQVPGDVDFFEDYLGNTPTTRDGHYGLDIQIANFAAQDAGIQVLAAAGGTVIDVRDGDFDRRVQFNFDPGNYVFIDHGDGWVSQYWHLRRDSITVNVNDVVTAGQVLGLVGSSGNSAAAHLHFEIQHYKSPVDPFAAPDDYFVSPLPYVIDPVLPNNLLDFGVTNDIYDGVHTGFGPTFDMVREKVSDIDTFPTSSQEVFAWAIFTSVEAGDTWRAQLYRPNGTLVNDFSNVMFTQPTDFEGDGDTDGSDFLAWQRGYGTNGGATRSDGDANFDGVVNQTDLDLWDLQYSRTVINGWNWSYYRPGFTENIPGTWRVDFLYNDVKVAEKTFQVSATLRPEIRVFEQPSNYPVIDGRTTPFDIGQVTQGNVGPTKMFKVENHGYVTLTISTLDLPAGYSFAEGLNISIPAGTSDSFTVRLDSTTVGVKSGQIVINSNDTSEAAYNFAIEGEVVAPLQAFFLDEALLEGTGATDETDADRVLETEPVTEPVLRVLAENRAAVASPSQSGDRARVRELRQPARDDEVTDEVFDFLGDDTLGS